jgi:hypothetical protein
MTIEGARKKIAEDKHSVSDSLKIIESLNSIKQMLLEVSRPARLAKFFKPNET